MTKVITKGLIGLQDLNIGSGTFTRATSVGGTIILTQIPIVGVGTGSPVGVVTANRGAIYCRTDGGVGSTLYLKTGGDGTANNWTAIG